ncbi:hypothetical protein [Photorhabdus caribbeanensis]|uniref:hypothetical protein n=1 Tax=Photorhabdus caribbeanensis TaxID=1004165 RepID=UPI001BD3BB4B|nr:hypothetical protein [Photorhabdus caribbeanensis]
MCISRDLLCLGIEATRATISSLEIMCADIAEFQLVKAVKDQNGWKVELPMAIFDPMNPELVKMSVTGN